MAKLTLPHLNAILAKYDLPPAEQVVGKAFFFSTSSSGAMSDRVLVGRINGIVLDDSGELELTTDADPDLVYPLSSICRNIDEDVGTTHDCWHAKYFGPLHQGPSEPLAYQYVPGELKIL